MMYASACLTRIHPAETPRCAAACSDESAGKPSELFFSHIRSDWASVPSKGDPAGVEALAAAAPARPPWRCVKCLLLRSCSVFRALSSAEALSLMCV